MSNRQGGGDWLNWGLGTALYAGALGIVAGSILAVAFGGADPGGDYLKIYLTVVTALFGAALGLGGSRVMDGFIDRRKARRTANLARIRIKRLRNAVEALRVMMSAKWLENLRKASPDAPLGFYFGAYQQIEVASSLAPEFSDFADSPGDYDVVDEVDRAFGFCQYRFKLPENITTSDEPGARAYFVSALRIPGTEKAVDKVIDELDRAEKHLRQRAWG